jgi:hypothetical protein
MKGEKGDVQHCSYTDYRVSYHSATSCWFPTCPYFELKDVTQVWGLVMDLVRARESTNSWAVTPCSLVEVHARLGGTYHLHLQGRRISQARDQQ